MLDGPRSLVLDAFMSLPCDHCGNAVPPSEVRCPHCAQPGLFPNVRAAASDAEKNALGSRYAYFLGEAERRGCRNAVLAFENAASRSQAVICRPPSEVLRLASSDRELYGTYYKALSAGVRLPEGNEWDQLRTQTDAALFPGYAADIRFGALTLDGSGPWNYGNCALVMRDDMIAHRATVFEENSAVFMKRQRIPMGEGASAALGFRATWEDRGKLAATKNANSIDANTTPAKYPGLLLTSDTTTADDRFVEVHIWGSITRLTLEKVRARAPDSREERLTLDAARVMLARAGIPLEDV